MIATLHITNDKQKKNENQIIQKYSEIALTYSAFEALHQMAEEPIAYVS